MRHNSKGRVIIKETVVSTPPIGHVLSVSQLHRHTTSWDASLICCLSEEDAIFALLFSMHLWVPKSSQRKGNSKAIHTQNKTIPVFTTREYRVYAQSGAFWDRRHLDVHECIVAYARTATLLTYLSKH